MKTNKKKQKITLALLVASSLLGSPLQAMEVEIGGAYLGGFNAIKQRNHEKRVQFDYAANVDVNFELNDQLSGIVQFQMSPGSGTLGFSGDGVVVTDLNIVYTDENYPVTITAGSFDTPFGQQTAHLSNNADTLNNALIINPLLYSAFAGPMGTLNTLGVMSIYESQNGNITIAITNGTDESAANPEGTLEVVGFVESSPLLNDKLTLGASYMKSDDKGNSANNLSGFKADFSAWMLDAHAQITEKLTGKAYISGLTYGDDDVATDDDVISWMTEGAYRLGHYQLSGRISGWHPKDNDGIGSSTTLRNPGLATQGTVNTDQDIIRYEVGLDYFFSERVVLRSEVFWDNYSKINPNGNTDVVGALAFVNVLF
jgi:hypothetical protein